MSLTGTLGNPVSECECMESFHPMVRKWFLDTFDSPSKPQEMGWPEVNSGKSVLICAPTGSGKTMAAFLKCLDNLYQSKEANTKNTGFRVVYISPLKALNNDIYRNLEIPIKGIEDTARAASVTLPEIKVAIRTGDTTPKERRDMIKNPADILITTPESLFIMLTAEGSRKLFSTVRYVIVDEIHALVSNKRGTHLSISLERLEKLANRRLIRIGLSATLNPLEEVASYLAGFSVKNVDSDISVKPREVTILNCDVHKKLDIMIDIPVKEMTELDNNTIWPEIHRQLLTLIRSHKSTLIFVNNRRLAEWVASGINNLVEETLVKTHHGSISKEVRKELENQFRDGSLKCMIATSTLELGIDIGHIDLVVQVGAPQTVSQMLQRIGRAGHQLNAISKGYVIPKTRADLLRAAFIGYEVKKYRVESVHIPLNCLDILAQQLTAMACQGEWDVEEAFFLMKGSYPYKNLTLDEFENVLKMLANPSPEENPGTYKPRVMYDWVSGKFWGTSLGRMLSFLGAGTITDKGYYPVYEKGTNKRVGELQEEFVFETRVGERFFLGSSVWCLDSVEHDRVFVTPTNESGGKIPFWLGDKVLWDFETGSQFGEFLRQLEERLDRDEFFQWTHDKCGLGRTAAENLHSYLKKQIEVTTSLSTDNKVVCEYFSDEAGQYRIFINSSFGGKVNAVLATLLHYHLTEILKCQIEYMYSDDGMLFHILGYPGTLSGIFNILSIEDMERELFELLPSTPVYNINLRYNLTRALLVNVKQAGKRSPMWIQRLRSAEMVESISKSQDHPMILETYRECFYDYLDAVNAYLVLEKIRDNSIKVLDVYTSGPSPFSAELVFNFWMIYQYVGDMPIAEKRNQLLVTDKKILELAVGKDGAYELLDERAINIVEEELLVQKYGRSIKNVNDLYHFIFSLGELKAEPFAAKVLTSLEEESCNNYLKELEDQGRIMRIPLTDCNEGYWIAVEDFPMYCAAFALKNSEVKIRLGEPELEHMVAAGEWVNSYILELNPDNVSSAVHILRRSLRYKVPFTIKSIQKQYPISTKLLKAALKKLIVLGEITLLKDGRKSEEAIYCHSKVYERIRRKTVELARLDIKPKRMETYLSYICQYQKVTQSIEQGEELLKAVIQQLRGLFLPVEYWERFVFPSRIKNYNPQMLDSLCSMGFVRWVGRLNKKCKEVAFYPREDFLKVITFDVNEVSFTEKEQKVYQLLVTKPAGFTYDYSQDMKIDQIELLEILEGLVWKGVVTNDLFSSVNYYQDVKKKNLWERYGSYPQTGRWTVIQWSKSTNDTVQLQYYVNMLLDRYGIISKEIISYENPAVKWTDIYEFLKQNEFFSGVKRGLFIDKISGIQYAKDEFIESLRLNETSLETKKEFVTLSSCDPANLLGIFKNENKTVRITRNLATALVFYNGRIVLIVKQYGKVLVPVTDNKEILLKAIRNFVESFQNCQIWNEHSSITTLYWEKDGQPIQQSIVYPEVKEQGYKSWYKGIVLYK